MSQKIHKSPTKKKSTAQTDFFGDAMVKPLERFVSGVQFSQLIAGFDDAKLRRLAAELQPGTQTAWIPKPTRGKYDLLQTIRGAAAWLQNQITTRDGLPERYASYGEFEAQTRFPKTMVEYAIKHGCKCRDDHGRISLTPFLEYFAPILRKIFAGGGVQIKGVEGMEDLDLDLQRAHVAKEDAHARRRDNAIADLVIHSRDGLKDEIWENGIKHVADAWKNYDNTTGPVLEKILRTANVPADIIAQVRAAATAGVKAPIEKLRATLLQKTEMNEKS